MLYRILLFSVTSKWISHRYRYAPSHFNLPPICLSISTRDWYQFSSVQSLSRVPLFVNPMNHSTPGLPVHHKLPEFTQTHAHRVGDAIQPSHPLSSSSPPAPNPSQHQGLFQRVNSSLEKGLLRSFSHYLIGLFVFLVLSCMSCFYILEINPL